MCSFSRHKIDFNSSEIRAFSGNSKVHFLRSQECRNYNGLAHPPPPLYIGIAVEWTRSHFHTGNSSIPPWIHSPRPVAQRGGLLQTKSATFAPKREKNKHPFIFLLLKGWSLAASNDFPSLSLSKCMGNWQRQKGGGRRREGILVSANRFTFRFSSPLPRQGEQTSKEKQWGCIQEAIDERNEL